MNSCLYEGSVRHRRHGAVPEEFRYPLFMVYLDLAELPQRYFGQCFNPVSFYYCYDPSGEEIVAVVAHVTNTPWGEQHAYVLPVERAAGHAPRLRLRGARYFPHPGREAVPT